LRSWTVPGLEPHYVEALVHRAIVLNELGREGEADAAFRRAAQVGGEPRQASRPRGREAGQSAAALATRTSGRRLDAGDRGVQEALSWAAFHDLATSWAHAARGGRALDAREHFEIIVRARPGYSTRRDARARCYLPGRPRGEGGVGGMSRAPAEDPRVEAYLAMLVRNDAAVRSPCRLRRDGDPPSAHTSARSGRKKNLETLACSPSRWGLPASRAPPTMKSWATGLRGRGVPRRARRVPAG